MNGRSTPAPAAPAYRRLSVEQRRTQLLAAAVDLFGHRRPEDVSVDDVAAAAGVSRPLVYRYFPGGKQQLYEAAMRNAAEELRACFVEPAEGEMTQRLSNALDRYLAYVDEHDAAYSALLRGGSVAETSRTDAIVDGVRRSAAEQILMHLGAPRPGPRLAMMVRSWIASVEAVSLTWLDEGKRPPAQELRRWLVDHFIALLLVSSTTDQQTAEVALAALERESAGSPAGDLARRVTPLAQAVAHLLPPAVS
ncbi:TetR/AcrR family transcriptional regulator [Actinacidiphila glaucinigra]|uniref:TetR/AcrR family transcriptional regulator n=1 Tax=Actinacidiphila glaucinigra TaxID=235986 RepID=UPI002DDBFD74|nr:TetR/AcrR family transcriptional regulator [Actinacidiphila glaucinigra]WSD60136.1 TetR/AcrR family transcriptional regulator [Actinacidiphila glaucinigra]